MSFINPNFRKKTKKEVIKEDNVEIIDVNFNNVKLEGEPRRYDIPSKEESIISLDDIIDEKKEEIEFEYIDLPSNASLTSVPRVEEFPQSEVAKIQINYCNSINKTISM